MATSDKYDRQLRLWGANGQHALGNTHVILIGASAVGTETLKNLVLPGIGFFTVVDDATVTTQDLSSNFFSPCDGKSRAKATKEYLMELNPDAHGAFETVPNLMEVSDWKSVVNRFRGGKRILVIASDLEPDALEKLSTVCFDEKIVLLAVHSYGLIGVVRIQLPGTVPLLDPKPANVHPDLRLQMSFPGLDAMANKIQLSTLKSHQHGRVPYPIILLQALKTWKHSHDGKLPQSFSEKKEFQACVKSMRRDENEINFQEAVQNAYLAYTEQPITVPSDLDSTTTLGKLHQGLKSFLSRHDGRPPLNGSIPDMTASTEWYVQLQSIYKDQADRDLAEMKELCVGVSGDDVASFCANVFTADQICGRRMVEEFQKQPDDDSLNNLRMAMMDPYEIQEHTPLLWYLGFRACQVFKKKYSRYPGTADDWKLDAAVLHDTCWKEIINHYKLEGQDLVNSRGGDICVELARYANAEIHSIASVVGGVASQEAVKIITGQYIPLDNTYLFNGIASVAGVYKF